MNVIWLTNIPPPEASLLMNEKPSPFGGWFVSSAAALTEHKGIELSIAFPKNGLKDILVISGAKTKYYAFPPISNEEVKENTHLNKIVDEAEPDLVHIFGTEYPHSLAMINTCIRKNIKAIVSIQGLVSIYEKHYMACLPPKIQNRFTFRDFVKQSNLKQQHRRFIERGMLEIEALQKVKYVIGRTTWDKACAYHINHDAQYFHCNETLREEFYKHTWNIDKCEKYSIFVSQGSYPIKGLHFMLEAMPLILSQFPETKLYIGGHNIIKSDTLKDRMRHSSYGKYIKELINKYNLNDKVFFTGILDEKKMCKRYLNSHIFVCPSSIENSPNSLGEAMILGVPCVASHVGGTPDLLKHGEEGYVYQFDAPYMLSYYVCNIFSNKELSVFFSKKAKEHATKIHNEKENINTLIQIYNKVLFGYI